jgi:hypothetical protein
MPKFFPPAKTMQLRSNITGFRQEDREPLGLTWERMKESARNCTNHGMKRLLILHLFYNALNSTLILLHPGDEFADRDVEVTSGVCAQCAFFGFYRESAMAVAEAQGLVPSS